jgi:TusA-related sulfurtransferase
MLIRSASTRTFHDALSALLRVVLHFATWLAEAGVAEATIKRLMGHAGSGVTQQHYTAQTLATLHAAVESIRLDLSAANGFELPMRAVPGTDRTPKTDGLTADFTAGLTAGRSKPEGKSSMISRERDTGLEPATFGLGSARNCLQNAAAECARPNSSEGTPVDGAPECTIGADSDARGKRCGVPAVRIEEAIRALQAGDVETALRLLRSDDSATRANVTAPAADKNLPSRMPSDSSHERNT